MNWALKSITEASIGDIDDDDVKRIEIEGRRVENQRFKERERVLSEIWWNGGSQVLEGKVVYIVDEEAY